MAADLEILQTVLEYCYSGWEPAAQKGWDWGEFFQNWHSLLAGSPPEWNTEDAFRPWEEYLRFQLDNHSGPIGSFATRVRSHSVFVRGSVTARVERWRDQIGAEGRIDSDETGSQFRPAILTVQNGTKLISVSALVYPGGESKWQAVFCGGVWVPVETINNSGNYPGETPCDGDMRAFHYGKLANRIAYCRIPTLSGDLIEAASQCKPTLDRPEDLDAIVIDLRGNKGGAAELVLDILRPFLPFRQRQAKPISVRVKESLLTAAITWGAAQAIIAGRTGVLTEPMRTFIQRELDKLISKSRPPGKPVFHEYCSDWRFQQHIFPDSLPEGTPLVLVLIDSRCASDGEYLAYLLAAHRGCVLAGANTAGMAQFAQPGRLVLPHTGVSFRMATAIADIYGDNRQFDGYGLNADLLIPDGHPLDRSALLNLVSSLRQRISGQAVA
jgi:hypothetical protein